MTMNIIEIVFIVFGMIAIAFVLVLLIKIEADNKKRYRDLYDKGYKKGYNDGFYKAVEELLIPIKMPPEGKTITLPKWRKTE